VIGENGGELLLVLRLQKVFNRPFWQLGKGFIGWCKDCEGAFAFQRVDKAGCLYGGYERGEVAGTDRRVDDILGRFGMAGGNGVTRHCQYGDGGNHIACSFHRTLPFGFSSKQLLDLRHNPWRWIMENSATG